MSSAATAKIEKACKDLTETCKDVLKMNLLNIVKEGFIKLPADQMSVVMNVINNSLDEAFWRCRPMVLSTVEEALKANK